jgi:hypothetical protein
MPHEVLPREFDRDHKIAQAFYNPGEEIGRHRLRAAIGFDPLCILGMHRHGVRALFRRRRIGHGTVTYSASFRVLFRQFRSLCGHRDPHES